MRKYLTKMGNDKSINLGFPIKSAHVLDMFTRIKFNFLRF